MSYIQHIDRAPLVTYTACILAATCSYNGKHPATLKISSKMGSPESCCNKITSGVLVMKNPVGVYYCKKEMIPCCKDSYYKINVLADLPPVFDMVISY
jgi:hypothetical protein